MPLPELELVERIRRLAGASPGVRLGIGDDAALLRLPRGQQAVVTTDLSVEGVHFRRDWHPPESVGHRCLARGLSDLAAMGARPQAAFLSLALPSRLPQAWVDGFLAGLLGLARANDITLAGGDLSSGPAITADIVLVGSVPSGSALLRSSARPGDLIYVSGELGGSAAVLQDLRGRFGAKSSRRGTSNSAARADQRQLRRQPLTRHFFPEPRVVLGETLRRRKLASAAMDLSDGLALDLARLARASGVGAILHADAIPLAQLRGAPVALDLALHGGEDYELLFTAPPSKKVPRRIAGVPVTCIGEITRGRGLLLLDATGRRRRLPARGWEHFTS